MVKILLINGPNLNLIGEREPDLYGHETLATLESRLSQKAREREVSVECHQSNHEGILLDLIHSQRRLSDHPADGIIINPGAYTHTSVALRDALILSQLPIVEVHISNLAQRETFRQRSLISDVVLGTIGGFGIYGYELALFALINHLSVGANEASGSHSSGPDQH